MDTIGTPLVEGCRLEQAVTCVEQGDRAGILGRPALASVLDDPPPTDDGAGHRRRLAAGESVAACRIAYRTASSGALNA